MYIFMHHFKFFVIIKSFLFRTVIFHNDKLNVRISVFSEDRIHTFFKVFLMIFIRNNDRYQRFFLPVIFCPVHPVKCCILHSCRNFHPVIMCLYRASSCLKSVQLALRICSRRLHMASPVIQNLWNMSDIFRILTTF